MNQIEHIDPSTLTEPSHISNDSVMYTDDVPLLSMLSNTDQWQLDPEMFMSTGEVPDKLYVESKHPQLPNGKRVYVGVARETRSRPRWWEFWRRNEIFDDYGDYRLFFVTENPTAYPPGIALSLHETIVSFGILSSIEWEVSEGPIDE